MRPMRRLLCVFSLLLLLLPAASVAQVGNTPRPAPTTHVIAVLSAMTLEIETLGQELTDKTEMTVEGIRFTTGSLKDRKVVLTHSGMGKVNAATAATLLVEQFQPTHVLFTGIAGGLNPDLRPGDVVIGAKTAYHDYGEWTPEGFRVGRSVDPFTGKPNPLFFPADAGLLAVAEWSWGCVSAIDSQGRTIWVADAHRGDGQRYAVRADEKLTAFLELEATVRPAGRPESRGAVK
jgi:adenosylhomocysteine nucleosidase